MAKRPEESEEPSAVNSATESPAWQANTRARLGGQAPTHTVELAIAKGRNQATASVTLSRSCSRVPAQPACRYVGRARHGLRRRSRRARDRRAHERRGDGRARLPSRFHLLVEIEVRADRKRRSAAGPRVLKPPQIYNAAVGRRPPLRFQELQVMHPSVDAVDHGEGVP